MLLVTMEEGGAMMTRAGGRLGGAGPIVLRRAIGEGRRWGSPPPGADAPPPDAPVLWRGFVRGEPPQRARAHEIVLLDGAARLIKSRPARLWHNGAMAQLRGSRPDRPLAVDLRLDCILWGRTATIDLDEQLLTELLERAAIIAHGRQIRERRLVAAAAADAPRMLLTLLRFREAP
jgi:hypothetical protein